MLAISRIGLAGWSSVLLLTAFTVQAEDAASPAVANGTEIIAVSDNVDSSEAPVDSTSTDVAENSETITASDSAELSASINDTAKYDWAFTGYVAWLSGDQLGDMLLFQAELVSSYLKKPLLVDYTVSISWFSENKKMVLSFCICC